MVTLPHCDFYPQATKALQDHLGQTHFLESKEMRGALELQDSLDRKDGLGTQGPRASLVYSVFRGRKVQCGAGAVGRGLQNQHGALVLTVLSSLQGPRVNKDSWATPGPLGPWVTEAPKDPKATKDSQVSGAWG
jgi:hypothetical protein